MISAGMLDAILRQVAGSPDTVAQIAQKVGIDPGLAEKAVAALGKSHAEPGDTVELAAQKADLDVGKLSDVLTQLGVEGVLGDLAGKLDANPQLLGILDMLDRDGDGNPLDDIAGMAKGLFGKD